MQSQTSLSPGETVAERYRVIDCIGTGGFSSVYRAVEPALGRDVALKVLDLDDAPSESTEEAPRHRTERFRREAKLVARLKHPSTVTLHDFGTTETGAFYMALEFVEGTPLDCGPDRPAPPARVVRWLLQALGSLAEAHEYGVLHRDIKPSNLMLSERADRRERLKLIDFGVAKPLRTTEADTLRPLTLQSRVLGTPRYAAPEYVGEESPSPASDLYSLGLVAHELLLDRRPVPGERPMQILEYHLSREFRVAIPSTPRIPEHLRQIVNRMTARSLEERYQTAAGLRADLERLPDASDPCGMTAVMRRSPAATAAATAETPDPATEATPGDHSSEASIAGKSPPASDSSCASETPAADAKGSTTVTAQLPIPDDADRPDPYPTSTTTTNPTPRERPRPDDADGVVRADDAIRSDGPPISQGARADSERPSRPPVPRRNPLPTRECRVDTVPDAARSSPMLEPMNWYLAAATIGFAVAALSVAVYTV